MRSLRDLAAELRTDALDGLGEAERERFVDTLLLIKANLLNVNANGHVAKSAAPPEVIVDAGRARAADG
jgi:hypothetical protein